MAQKPRIKRIDKVGSTAGIPRARTIEDFKSQKWIVDRFYRLLGRSSFFWDSPEDTLGVAISRGQNYFDLKDTGARIKSLDQFPKENIRTATRLEELAERESKAGHIETARDYYFRACHFYVLAAWGIFDSSDKELIWLTERIRSSFDRLMEQNWYPMERVEIPFEGKTIPGILSLTPGRNKAPTILFVPGMDLHKENGLNYLQNPYVLRGMNSLAIDGPGQGESLIRQIWVDEENYGRAGKAAIEYLLQRPEVDSEKIGVHGASMGTYWAPLIALDNPRVKALSSHMSTQCNKDHIFNETSPNFRLRFMWMAGNLDDEQFDKMAAKMTLEGKEHRIQCPHIIFHGEFDHLCSTAEMYRYFNSLGSAIKELRIYEDQSHGVFRFSDEVTSMSADWLRDRLNQIPPSQNRKIVLVDGNKTEHNVDEERLASGFSAFQSR